MKKLKTKPWYNNAAAVCAGVFLYVVLMNLPKIMTSFGTFVSYFTPVIHGCVIAYIVNPLAVFIKKRFFKKGNTIPNLLAFAIVIALIALFLVILIPQVIESLTALSSNLPNYASSAEDTLHRLGIKKLEKYIHNTFSSSEKIIAAVSAYVTNNTRSVLETSAVAGKSVINFFISFFLSFYLIGEKGKIKAGLVRLLRVLTPKDRFAARISFLKKCNVILNRYIVYNLLDSLVIGVSNAILMLIFGLPYTGLISLAVGFTNMIPTFGPLFGAVIGACILALSNPVHALIFIAITAVLQITDGYLLKPKLFGTSLGVSGLWILIGIIAGGRMFGITGILLAIPAVAILDLIYEDYLLPYLERKQIGERLI